VRQGTPVAVAFCMGAGVVLAYFLAAPQPISYLIRPLSAVLVISVVLGLLASVFGRSSHLVAAFLMAWLVQPGSGIALTLASLAAAVIVWRLWSGRTVDMQKPIAAAAVVFLVVGLAPMVLHVSWSTPANTPDLGRPTFLILLDGFPRADTLESLGVDIGWFTSELEDRGFDHYPSATSLYVSTWRTLTHLLTGEPPREDWTTVEEMRTARNSWTLPRGFVAVAPPLGSVTIPNVPTLNPGGPTVLDVALLQGSAVASLSGRYVMDGMRFQVERSLDLIATTEATQVFAHLLAPHPPFLYDGDSPRDMPSCWPYCNIFTDPGGPRDVEGYLQWLLPRLIDVVDQVIGHHPDAEIVLFSDHGGRFSEDEMDEWYRVFLAARTPSRPGLFTGSPHPSSILPELRQS